MMMGPGATIFQVGRAGGGGRSSSPSPLTRLRINLRSRKSAEISAIVARWRCCLSVLLWFCSVFSNALMWFYYVFFSVGIMESALGRVICRERTFNPTNAPTTCHQAYPFVRSDIVPHHSKSI
jgi:hypothetical protein